MNEPLEYGYHSSLTVRVPLASMSVPDQIRLCQDLAKSLLMSDLLRDEHHAALSNYLAEVLDRSRK